MTILNRFSRLLQADIHAVLDSIEEPEILLKQSLREMEEEIAVTNQRYKNLQLDCKQMNGRKVELTHTIVQLDEEINVCLKSNNDKLAKSMIKRKLASERFVELLTKKITDIENQQAELIDQKKHYTQQLETIHQKAELFSESKADDIDRIQVGLPDISVSDDEVEVALLKAKQSYTVKSKGK